ncbi:MAG: LPS export ABC transporter periplasmic protein LptC [bacterium]|nr:LPS export ABC transporter periplasmic protein LptC [bacterium]
MDFIKDFLIKCVEFAKAAITKYKSFNRRRRIFVLVIMVIVFILLWAFITASVITCNFNRTQIKGKEDDQRVNAFGIIITETKENSKYFEIYGENGNYNNDDDIAILNNVIGNFFNKDNKVVMSFQSSKGSYNAKTKQITLYDNTYIVIENGTTLSADKLIWSGSDVDTIAKGHVKIKKDNDMIAVADECIISPGYEKFKIKGKTTTKIFGDKEK